VSAPDSLPNFAPLDSIPGTRGATTRADVIAEARSWLDVPYVHQGRSRAGVDCAGLVIVVARSLGLVAPDFDVNGYARTPDGSSLLEICDALMTRIQLWQLRPGNVLVIRFGQEPQHLGIVGDYLYGGLSLIQALGTSDGKGRVIEWQLTKRKGWKPAQAYALRGVL
jgi:cell wall-associated NlpC family hydrolase